MVENVRKVPTANDSDEEYDIYWNETNKAYATEGFSDANNTEHLFSQDFDYPAKNVEWSDCRDLVLVKNTPSYYMSGNFKNDRIF